MVFIYFSNSNLTSYWSVFSPSLSVAVCWMILRMTPAASAPWAVSPRILT